MPEAVGEKVLELAGKAAGVLRDRAGIENARLEAEQMLAAVLGLDRLGLYLQFDRPVTNEELERYRAMVRRRLKREPLQYILGTVGFRHLVLHVDARVLIPRPETEVLVGEVLSWAADRPVSSALDIGTGSGAIALSLARESNVERVVATDASEGALEVARANAERLGLADRVELRLGRTWEPVRADEQFDIIVSNPPYVAETERETLQPEVRDWEPAEALFAANTGLDMLDAIVAGAPEHLRPGGLLAVEVGLGQAETVRERAQARGLRNVRIAQDLTGRDRIVLAEQP